MTALRQFYQMYVRSKAYAVRAALWPDSINKTTGATDFTGDPQGFTDEIRGQRAKELRAAGYKLDEEIDISGWDPMTTMLMRFAQGIMWVMPGTQAGSDGSIQSGSHGLPIPEGAIKTSLDPADYPAIPDPLPDLPAPPPPVPMDPDPVGSVLVPAFVPGGLGTSFRTKPTDGFGIGGVWTGSHLGYTGKFTKSAEMMGMEIVWVLTAVQ